MGKFARLGNDLYDGDVSIDFVGRNVALVLHLGRHRRCSPSSASSCQGPQLRHRVHRRRAVPRHAARRPGHPGQRRRAARGGRRHRHRGRRAARSSPPPATTRSWSRPRSSPTAESDRGHRRDHRRDRRASTRTTSPRTRSAPAGARRSPSAPCSACVVFLVLVVLFIWAYFREWKMSVAAIVALAHDIVITVGVYALSGFEVTPATVTGLLTILGFSLYDTVVVFDKVRENTKDLRGEPARPTPRPPTWRSTRPWCARSTPRSWR